ncbi:MAG: helix-turn-helix domain-containing protein [Actinoallomurus sp.]
MRLRYAYRLDPTPAQRTALAKAFGCARVVFNDGLRARQDARAAGLPYICQEHPRRRTGGEAKRLPHQWAGRRTPSRWRAGKTTPPGGTAQRSRKPQRRRMNRHGLNPQPSGWGARQGMQGTESRS